MVYEWTSTVKIPRAKLVRHLQALVDTNQWSNAPPSYHSTPKTNPYTEKPISTVPRNSILDVEATQGHAISASEHIHHFKSSFKEKKKTKRLLSCIQCAQDSTIHGLKFIARRTEFIVARIVWFLAVLTCICACVALVIVGFSRYLKAEVKTSTSVEYAREIDFPAITICSENLVRKAVVGRSDELIRALVGFLVDDERQLNEILNRSLATCSTAQRSNTTKPPSVMEVYAQLNRTGLVRTMQSMAPDSNYSVKRCWWLGREENCTELFLNHFTDYGWCFTFNPSSTIIKMNNLGFGWDDTAYGLKADFKQFALDSTGPINGLRLMLKVNQDDYCMTRHGAAGFKALIHNPNEQPLFFTREAYSLAPGMETSIAVRFERVTKFTKELGRCTDFISLNFYPNLTGYFREACYLECFTNFVYNACSCIVPYGPPNANKIKMKQNADNVYVMLCFGPTFSCMKRYEREFLNVGLDKRCDHCKEACNETRTMVSSSSALFPANHLVPFYVRTLNDPILDTINHAKDNGTLMAAEKYLRDNYLTVNIYVESKLIDIIQEERDFKVEDLVSYLGGTIGFLLGMSLLSLLEIFQAAIYFAVPGIWRSPY